MRISNIYDFVIILIKKLENECIKYKEKSEDISKVKILKSELSDLHELRRIIEEFENFNNSKQNK